MASKEDEKAEASVVMASKADEKGAATEKDSAAGMDVDVDEGKKTKKQLKDMFKFDEYIYEVLKQAHPDIGISSSALKMMNDILSNMMLKLSKDASKFNKIRKKNSPLVEPDISAAVWDDFPEEMANRALLHAFKTVIKYNV